jgi:hypothetical protein
MKTSKKALNTPRALMQIRCFDRNRVGGGFG